MSLNREQPMRPFLDELADAFEDAMPLEYARTFDTVADMQAATDLQAGMTCHTNGFHAAGDGGAAYYTIGTTGTANEMDVLALQGGLHATLVVTEPYVTPEQFGAYGDGTHDDSGYIQRAVSTKKQVRLSNKTYLCNQPIDLSIGAILTGVSKSETIIYFSNDADYGFQADSYCVIENLLITGTPNLSSRSYIGVKCVAGANGIILRNMQVNFFTYGVYIPTYIWGSKIIDVRLNRCEYALYVEQSETGLSVFVDFENAYCNHCEHPIYSVNTAIFASLTSCNFGIDNVGAFNLFDSRMIFDSCNFECDTKVTGSGSLINCDNDAMLNFVNCAFQPRCESTVFFFGNSGRQATFKNCRYFPLSSNEMPQTSFFDVQNITMQSEGQILYNDFNSLPDVPLSSYSAKKGMFMKDSVSGLNDGISTYDFANVNTNYAIHGIDLNDVTDVFFIGYSLTNAPATGWWAVFTLKNPNNSVGVQLAFATHSSACYKRNLASGTWSSWAAFTLA